MQFLSIIALQLICIISLTYAEDAILTVGDCILPKHKPNSKRTGLNRLKALSGEV